MTRRRITVWIVLSAAVIGALIFSWRYGQDDREGTLSFGGIQQRTQKVSRQQEAPSGAPNLIIISIDTLRADRLGCYGYDRPTSPSIDALAERGVRFENVIAESSWTLPSHVSMFTGLLPSAHGVHNPSQKLADEIPTLAEILFEHGYRTAGFCGGAYLRKSYGFGRGFETYNEDVSNLRLAVSLGMEQMYQFRQKDEPFFVFLHTYDVHCPYDPSPEFADSFRTTPPQDHLYTTGKCAPEYFNKMGLRPGQVKFLSDQYDASIREADEDLSNFLYLAEHKNWDNTILVFISDHGEAFHEHGILGHRGVHIETLKVPLIIAGPDLEPRVVSENVGLADLVPTLLEMLDIPAPPVQGKSLMPLINGENADWPERAMISESLDGHRSIVRGRMHFIREFAPDGTTTEELFDLASDPTEQHNLAGERPELTGELAKILSSRLEETVSQATPRQPLPEKELKQLRSLGYVK